MSATPCPVCGTSLDEHPGAAMVAVDPAEVGAAVRTVLASVGLPADWASAVTSEELQTVRLTLAIVAAVRAQQWEQVERAGAEAS